MLKTIVLMININQPMLDTANISMVSDRLYTEESCSILANTLNETSIDTDQYFFCLDYQEAAWNQTWSGN